MHSRKFDFLIEAFHFSFIKVVYGTCFLWICCTHPFLSWASASETVVISLTLIILFQFFEHFKIIFTMMYVTVKFFTGNGWQKINYPFIVITLGIIFVVTVIFFLIYYWQVHFEFCFVVQRCILTEEIFMTLLPLVIGCSLPLPFLNENILPGCSWSLFSTIWPLGCLLLWNNIFSFYCLLQYEN